MTPSSKSFWLKKYFEKLLTTRDHIGGISMPLQVVKQFFLLGTEIK
jgi:hypothetical protein